MALYCCFKMSTNRSTRFHDSEEFSDCKIICGSYHFNVHKIILSVQSEYFRAALKRSTFKVRNTFTPTNKQTHR